MGPFRPSKPVCCSHSILPELELEFFLSSGGALPEVASSSGRVAPRKGCPPPTPFFTGRDDILLHMHKYFSEPSKLRRVFVLYGLGGSGKSEISRKFVEVAQESEPKRCISIPH